MSDSDDTTQSGDETVEQTQEREQEATVDLGEAAGAEAAKQVPSKPKLNDTKLSPEQRAEVEALLKAAEESAASRAVNEFKRKAESTGQYRSAEDVQRMIAEALDEERTRNQVASEARSSFDANLGKLGIVPGSDEYKAVAKAYSEMESEGAITPKALLTEKGVKALAFAAGVIESEAASGPQRGFDTTYRIELDPPVKGQETTEDKMWQAVNKAMGR